MKTKKKILIVDDERVIRDLLERLLKGSGHEAISAEDGETALNLIKTENFDLILLDLKLPGIDGVKILKEIKKLNKKLTVILISAYLTDDIIKQTSELGVVDYVKKPFDIYRVKNQIKKVLKQ
ncbi:MAG: response regulator [Omnitrophica bacterium]|nr:response regulator [Candidatus Omnitrophota bacterium]